MDKFLKELINSRDIKPEDSFKELVNKLMAKGARLNEKTSGHVDAYDSESLFDGKIYRGNIYMFLYDAKNPTKYSYKGEDVYFSDNMPVVLMLSELRNAIRGINLNFCNKALKILILNLIQNLDEDFYNGGALKLAFNKSLVISKNVYSFLSKPTAESEIIAYLQHLYKNVDFSSIIRNYAISNIKNMRLIEPWQWKYIPSLNYEGSIKKDSLDAILKLSGISTIRL